MKRVIGYIRVSTDGQDQSGLGLADQEQKIRAYCDLYGLSLVEIEKDSASGKSMDRPGLQAALGALKAGRADGLVIAKLDRLTRSVRDMGILLDGYFRDKFAFFVVAEQIDTSTAAGRFQLNLLASVAEWERETIGERTKAALAQKRARGEKTGGHCPYGFTQEGGKLVANQREQAILTEIRALRAKGEKLQTIADRLNREGIATKLGGEWSRALVCKMLKKAA